MLDKLNVAHGTTELSSIQLDSEEIDKEINENVVAKSRHRFSPAKLRDTLFVVAEAGLSIRDVRVYNDGAFLVSIDTSNELQSEQPNSVEDVLREKGY